LHEFEIDSFVRYWPFALLLRVFISFLLEIRSQASGFPFFHRVTFHFAFIHEFRPVFLIVSLLVALLILYFAFAFRV